MRSPSIAPMLPLLLAATLSACGGGGAHTLRYAPTSGMSRDLEVDIVRQSPGGLLAARLVGAVRVVEVRGETRRLSFTVGLARVHHNGELVVPEGHLGALARMEGVELRWIADARGRLIGTPEVRGARDAADAEVHLTLLDDIIQAAGTLPEGGVDVGSTWSVPWHLHGLGAEAELDGELVSTLDAIDEETATIGMAGRLSLARQETSTGWTIEGTGTAEGQARVVPSTGAIRETVLVIQVDTAATDPDGVESDLRVVAEVRIRPADDDRIDPPGSLLACDELLHSMTWPQLSPSHEADAMTYARPVADRVAAAEGESWTAPAGALIRLERDGAWVDGVHNADLTLFAHEHSEVATGVVLLDVAPDVPVERVAEVAALFGQPKLLVGTGGDHISPAEFMNAIDEAAGSCDAIMVAARVAAEETRLRKGYVLAEGARAALGSCGCDVPDMGAMHALIGMAATGGVAASLRLLDIDASRLRSAPAGALAADLPVLLAVSPPTSTPGSAETREEEEEVE